MITIGNDAFSNCNGLTTIIIGNNVKKIENNAFSFCNELTSVIFGNNDLIIGNSVINFDNMIFSGCHSLSSVHYCRNISIFISSNLFEECSSDLQVYVTPSYIENYQKFADRYVKEGAICSIQKPTSTFSYYMYVSNINYYILFLYPLYFAFYLRNEF